MSEPIKRRALFPVAAPAPATPLSEAAVSEVASRHGFEAAEPVGEGSGPRRKRQPTGRDHQFNVRLKRETMDFIYAEANGRNIPVAQVVEEMVEALKALRGKV